MSTPNSNGGNEPGNGERITADSDRDFIVHQFQDINGVVGVGFTVIDPFTNRTQPNDRRESLLNQLRTALPQLDENGNEGNPLRTAGGTIFFISLADTESPYRANDEALETLVPVDVETLDPSDRCCSICYEPLTTKPGIDTDADANTNTDTNTETNTETNTNTNLNANEEPSDRMEVSASEETATSNEPLDTESSMATDENTNTNAAETREEPASEENDEMETDEPHFALKMPKCGHIFGSSCLRPWLRTSAVCPLCREPLDVDNRRDTGEENGFRGTHHTHSLDDEITEQLRRQAEEVQRARMSPQLVLALNDYMDLVNSGQRNPPATATQLQEQHERHRASIRSLINSLSGNRAFLEEQLREISRETEAAGNSEASSQPESAAAAETTTSSQTDGASTGSAGSTGSTGSTSSTSSASSAGPNGPNASRPAGMPPFMGAPPNIAEQIQSHYRAHAESLANTLRRGMPSDVMSVMARAHAEHQRIHEQHMRILAGLHTPSSAPGGAPGSSTPPTENAPPRAAASDGSSTSEGSASPQSSSSVSTATSADSVSASAPAAPAPAPAAPSTTTNSQADSGSRSSEPVTQPPTSARAGRLLNFVFAPYVPPVSATLVNPPVINIPIPQPHEGEVEHRVVFNSFPPGTNVPQNFTPDTFLPDLLPPSRLPHSPGRTFPFGQFHITHHYPRNPPVGRNPSNAGSAENTGNGSNDSNNSNDANGSPSSGNPNATNGSTGSNGSNDSANGSNGTTESGSSSNPSGSNANGASSNSDGPSDGADTPRTTTVRFLNVMPRPFNPNMSLFARDPALLRRLQHQETQRIFRDLRVRQAGRLMRVFTQNPANRTRTPPPAETTETAATSGPSDNQPEQANADTVNDIQSTTLSNEPVDPQQPDVSSLNEEDAEKLRRERRTPNANRRQHPYMR